MESDRRKLAAPYRGLHVSIRSAVRLFTVSIASKGVLEMRCYAANGSESHLERDINTAKDRDQTLHSLGCALDNVPPTLAYVSWEWSTINCAPTLRKCYTGWTTYSTQLPTSSFGPDDCEMLHRDGTARTWFAQKKAQEPSGAAAIVHWRFHVLNLDLHPLPVHKAVGKRGRADFCLDNGRGASRPKATY
ncbi:hypothetical protein BU24DRAFT_29714 [Aaosphaeria arxii CBS 175.79]|uniref:Uncharacterized protein n=1 Tax=Aaosphaeria arxii CBS 175.79 TaxID=1450172 RepID=A0A6A5Y9W4_9PLEO|nr:uncharacterized protein BU24DRAFT_29714 [Aaosphaeria arxii CBS 175.79]KAF2021807.1 hypothetical protein BU24DRAFT_29714 [Aaosphaeria arxii CBS 175.79]